MKLPDTRLVPVELEITRKPSAKSTQTLWQLGSPGLACDRKRTRTSNMYLDVVAFLKCEGFHHGGGKANLKAVAPLRNLRGALQ